MKPLKPFDIDFQVGNDEFRLELHKYHFKIFMKCGGRVGMLRVVPTQNICKEALKTISRTKWKYNDRKKILVRSVALDQVINTVLMKDDPMRTLQVRQAMGLV